MKLPRGGGALRRPSASMGVFLNDQPGHRIAIGRDRPQPRPLERHQGWILPAGSEGICEYDADLDLVTLALDDRLLLEAGVPMGALDFRPRTGAIDQVLLALILNADFAHSGETLYRETMQRALAARFSRVVHGSVHSVEPVEDARLRRAIVYIHDRLGEDLSLSDMASQAALSASQFARAFKASTGLSPLQYVIEQRLQRASVLLRTTRLSVAEISYKVGYGDVSRFGQHFKRRFGMTPAAARRA